MEVAVFGAQPPKDVVDRREQEASVCPHMVCAFEPGGSHFWKCERCGEYVHRLNTEHWRRAVGMVRT